MICIRKIKEMHLCLALEYTHGLRISDILKFKVKDASSAFYNIREKKTNKQKVYEFNKYLKKEMQDFVKGKDDNEYLFKSRTGSNKPITRQRAYQILKEACAKNGIYNIGTHTLRKTFRISHV